MAPRGVPCAGGISATSFRPGGPRGVLQSVQGYGAIRGNVVNENISLNFVIKLLTRRLPGRVHGAGLGIGMPRDGTIGPTRSLLDVAADRFGALFDDYSPLPGFGVQRLIDEVTPRFEAEFIDTGGRWPGGERAHPRDSQHAMVWVVRETLRTTIAEAYPPGMRNRFRRGYRRRDRLGGFRRFLGRTRQRIPREVTAMVPRGAPGAGYVSEVIL